MKSILIVIYSAQICIDILKMVYTITQNEDYENLDFLVKNNGFFIIVYLYEKVAKTSGFNNEFISLLFTLLEGCNASNTKLVPLVIQYIIFNFKVWKSANTQTIAYLLDRTFDLISRNENRIDCFHWALNAFYEFAMMQFQPCPELDKKFSKLILNQMIHNPKPNYASLILKYILPYNIAFASTLVNMIAVYQSKVK